MLTNKKKKKKKDRSSLQWLFSCFLCHFCSTGVCSDHTTDVFIYNDNGKTMNSENSGILYCRHLWYIRNINILQWNKNVINEWNKLAYKSKSKSRRSLRKCQNLANFQKIFYSSSIALLKVNTLSKWRSCHSPSSFQRNKQAASCCRCKGHLTPVFSTL